MEAGVTILMPVLDRVQGMEKVIKSANENTKDPHIIIVNSPGREAVKEELQRLFKLYVNVEWRTINVTHQPGDYARKINLALEWVFTDWFLTGADDIKFHPNWFENAMKVATDGIQVIGTNDLGSQRVMQGHHSTHTLVNTEYARDKGLTIDNMPGEVMSPQYWHEYMDDELVGVAKKRGIWAFAGDSIVEHLHPNWGKAETDSSYVQQRIRMLTSKGTYYMRRRAWT